MTVVKLLNGMWAVKNTDGSLCAAPFESSSAAWRWVDRQEGEPVSRSEQTGEYIFRQMWDAP